MNIQDLWELSLEPQLNSIKRDISEIKCDLKEFKDKNEQAHKDILDNNAKEHKEIIAVIDIIQNGNGILGHKALAKEWMEFKGKNKQKSDKVFKVALVTFNVILACFLGKMFMENKVEKIEKPVSKVEHYEKSLLCK